MTCTDLDFLLDRATDDDPLPPAANAHLRTCRRCQALAGALKQSRVAAGVRSEAVESIEGCLLKNLEPVHALPPKKLFFAAFLFIFVVLMAVGIFHLGAFAWAELDLTRRIMICTSLGASAALLAYSMVQQMFPGSKRHLSPAFLPVGTFVCLTLVLAALFEVGHSGRFISDGIPCFEAGDSLCGSGRNLVLADLTARGDAFTARDGRSMRRACRAYWRKRLGSSLLEF